jgi:hypothetical protein
MSIIYAPDNAVCKYISPTRVEVQYINSKTKRQERAVLELNMKEFTESIVYTDCYGDKCRREWNASPDRWCTACFDYIEEYEDFLDFFVNNKRLNYLRYFRCFISDVQFKPCEPVSKHKILENIENINQQICCLKAEISAWTVLMEETNSD